MTEIFQCYEYVIMKILLEKCNEENVTQNVHMIFTANCVCITSLEPQIW